MFEQPGFLGTGATLVSDLSLLAYILLIVPAMIVGFIFARRKMFEPQHKLTMTTITLVNWLIIAFLMAVRYAQAASASPRDASLILPTIHLAFGGTAQLLATYLVIRMWFENQLPAWFKVRRIKRYMRATLALWFITAALGIGTYFAWYVADSATSGGTVPAATEEATTAADDATQEATEAAGAATDEAAAPQVTEAAEPVATPEATPEATP
ncbi:MAG: hypothetical protein HXY40_16320 [Chloroflexi bacterium]|nr:hypothetical protein [Chloroflexota bacterium]